MILSLLYFHAKSSCMLIFSQSKETVTALSLVTAIPQLSLNSCAAELHTIEKPSCFWGCRCFGPYFLFFLKKCLYFMCISACMHFCTPPAFATSGGQKRTLDYLGLGYRRLWTLTRMVRTKSRSTARAKSAFKCWAFSRVHYFFVSCIKTDLFLLLYWLHKYV